MLKKLIRHWNDVVSKFCVRWVNGHVTVDSRRCINIEATLFQRCVSWHNVESTSFQGLFNFKCVEPTLKWRCFNNVCSLGEAWIEFLPITYLCKFQILLCITGVSNRSDKMEQTLWLRHQQLVPKCWWEYSRPSFYRRWNLRQFDLGSLIYQS